MPVPDFSAHKNRLRMTPCTAAVLSLSLSTPHSILLTLSSTLESFLSLRRSPLSLSIRPPSACDFSLSTHATKKRRELLFYFSFFF